MPEQLFTNAKIFTGEGEDRFASAFRIQDGLFEWVGDSAAIAGQPAIDLGGRTVLPGLIDSHTHPAIIVASGDAVDCFPPAVRSVDDLVTRLREHSAADAEPKAWILGRGFDDTKFPDRAMPSAADLDRVSAVQPVLVWRCDAHSAVCNTVALNLAGITAATPDPPGARFERDAAGRPTGVLTEMGAVAAVTQHIPPPKREDLVSALVRLGREFSAHGIVAACDLLSDRIDGSLEIFREAAAQGMPTQVALYPGWDPTAPLPDLHPTDREGAVRIGGVKVIMDGAYSNRTAWVRQPYPGSCDHGLRLVEDDDIRAAAYWARRNRVQVAIHAMGDRALDRILDLFSDWTPWLTGIPSIRIEHATIISDEYLVRLKAAKMAFGVATHSIFFFAEYDGYQEALRPDQFEDTYPLYRLYGGVQALALSSDRPATAWSDADDVMLSVQAAVTRRAYNGADLGQSSALTVPQALLLYTGRAQHLSPLENVGCIQPGFDGSFVVLDRDVFSVPADLISEVRVAETWIRGVPVFSRQAESG